MDIDQNTTKIEAQITQENQKEIQTKVKKIVKKTHEQPNKPTTIPSNTQARDRQKESNSKVDIFNSKQSSSNVNGRKESRPIETIGHEGFKNRVSIFERSKTNDPAKKEDQEPKKLDMSKFKFGGNNTKNTDSNPTTNSTTGVSSAIQAKLKAYLENARNRSKTVAHCDPVINRIKESKQEEQNQNQKLETEENNNMSGDDLNISEGEQEKTDETEENSQDHQNKNETNSPKDNIVENDDTKIVEISKEA